MKLDYEQKHSPETILGEFAMACSPIEMKAAYGWSTQPEPLPGEVLTAVYYDTDLVGWWTRKPFSIVRGQDFEIGVGVFPYFRGYGIGKQIIQEVERWGWDHAEFMVQEILGTNTRRLTSMLRESQNGSPWRYSGAHWYPVFLYLFTWGEGSYSPAKLEKAA